MDPDSSFERLGDWTPASIEKLLANGDVDDLVLIPIAITAWGTPNAKWSEGLCCLLGEHDNETVRGNAILGLGHLARTIGALEYGFSIERVRIALTDESSYVRGQAVAAADDLRHFLGVSIA